MTELRRAYGLLHVKAVDDEQRTISGIATTPAPDRQGDVLEPKGVTYRNPLPLLLYHDKQRPVGRVTFATPTAAGIAFTATLPRIAEAGALRDRVDEAWQSIKAGLITGVSVGYRILANGAELIKGGGLRLKAIEICELSLVTIPSNHEATILSVKSLDEAAIGRHLPGVAGALPVVRATKDAPNMGKKTTAEQISAFENTRAAKNARMVELMTKAAEEGVTLDAPQVEEYDGLALELKSIDAHLVRLRELEKLQIAAAVPALETKSTDLRQTSSVISVRANVPKGTAFTRYAMALARARGDMLLAVEYSKAWKDSTPEVELMLKAAVAPGSTTDPAWAGALVAAGNVTGEFIELLRPATILGKIRNLREVPFNANVPMQTAGGSYKWVGQAKPKPVTKLGLASTSLAMAKASGIIVLTEELVRSSSPSAESVVRADMIAGIAQFLDSQFIDPAVAEVANVSPASITNGTVPIESQGPLDDLALLMQALSAANIPLGGVTVIMSESNGFALGFLRDGNGGRTFPGVSAEGGSADGIQIITSNAAGTNVIGLQPRLILVADDGAVAIDVSREASIQMTDTPTDDPATAVLTSLWQDNLVGLRAERFINWKRATLTAVKYVANASYVPVEITP